MAEGGAAETHKDLQECPICFSEYKDPRLLACSHSFCLKCLQELALTQHKDSENTVCPLCREETILPEGKVDMLPSKSQDAAPQEQQGGQELKVMCQACDEENEAISRCIDCEHYLCQECQKAHQRWAALRTHKIVTLTELESEDSIYHLKNVPKCMKHQNQHVCFYCYTCDVLICNECTVFEHKTSMHSYDSIDQANTKCRQEVKKSISKTKNCIKKFVSVNPSFTHSRHRLDKMLAKTQIEISLKAEKEIAKIREKEEQLKQEARDIATKRDKEFAYATMAGQILSKVDKVMTSASCYEVLESKKKLLHELEEQVEVHSGLDIKHGMSFIGFKESQTDGELGALLLEERWHLVKTYEVKGQYHHLAALSTSDIVLAGSGGLTTLTPEGVVLSTKTCTPHQTGKSEDLQDPNDIRKPTAIAVNKDDQLIIIDSPAVKILDSTYQLLHQFIPGKVADIDSTPTCLAVNDSNLIAVGYKDKEQMSLHNPDGSLIRTLPAPKIDDHLTLNNQQLIYTTEERSFLHVYTNTVKKLIMGVDLYGNKQFTQTLKGSCPSGMCCDNSGDIYVSTYLQKRDRMNRVSTYQCIWHFSTHGNYIDSWEWDGTTHPCDITFTPERKLAAVRENFPCTEIRMSSLF